MVAYITLQACIRNKKMLGSKWFVFIDSLSYSFNISDLNVTWNHAKLKFDTNIMFLM